MTSFTSSRNKELSTHSRSQFFASVLQPKLSINQPNDVYEQEADSIAENVVQKQTSFFKPASSFVQKMQQKENNDAIFPSSTQQYLQTLSGGNSLSKNERNFFESQMNFDFSNVKIHTDKTANDSAKRLQAKAFTHGNDIVFANNEYQPNTTKGKKLMAHELTHVMQQNSQPSIQKKDDKTDGDDHTQSWENDMESFSKVAAENYLHVERNVLFDSIKTAQCSAESATSRTCIITTQMGAKITVLWSTDTHRVVVKADIGGERKACGYDYSAKGNGVTFNLIKCWAY